MHDPDVRCSERWARLRFAVVGPLLAAPPERGALRGELERLAQKTWQHPTTGEPVRFGMSTIERWYYAAKGAGQDPIGALARRVRRDAGTQPSLTEAVRELIHAQHREHPGWSYQLHVDNLAVLVEADRALGTMPSYATVRRYMKAHGLVRRRRPRRATAGARQAAARLAACEVRSYEAAYVHGLWHLDFHEGSRRVLTRRGWVTPQLLGVLDDRSRIACHLQWYLDETAEALVHGVSQAFQKRALPRALMTDNGSAMRSAEFRGGLATLGIVHEDTLPYSPYQNGKQEKLWDQVEGRLMAMLEGVEELTLTLLNEATQAWVEGEYNRSTHSEIGCAPITRLRDDRQVGRESPGSDALRRAFRAEVTRIQRRSDGTVSVKGQRFELPSRFRHMERVRLRYASWDLSSVDMVDQRTGEPVCVLLPLDKTRNADGHRRRHEPVDGRTDPVLAPAGGGVAPLLKKLMADYAATGLPPAYLPTEDLMDLEETDR